MAVTVIVEPQAKPGRRDALRQQVESSFATQGTGARGDLRGEQCEALVAPDVLVEIVDHESAEAHGALMEDAVVMAAMAPMIELPAAPPRTTGVR